MSPHISLNYSSQAAIYGGIASGWSLSIPAILDDTSQGWLRTHSPEVEKQQGATAADDDRFISTMAGGRPLVRVAEPTSAGVVFTFRSQNDASYTRYEKMTLTQDFWWRAYTSAGMVMTFGDKNLTSKCRNIGYGYAPLTSETDSFGNSVFYSYTSNGDDDCVISSVTWGVNASAGITLPFASMLFVWTTTVPPVSGFATGSQRSYRTGKKMVSGASQLSSILVTAFPPVAGGNANPSHTRQITLGYEPNAGATGSTIQHAPLRILTSIQESAWRDAHQYQVDLPAVTFDYAPQAVSLTATGSLPSPPWAAGLPIPQHTYNLAWGYRHSDGRWPSVEEMMVDLDGDGLLDRLSNTAPPGAPYASNCTASWQRNQGPDASGQLRFGPITPVQFGSGANMPRLKWGTGTVSVAGTSAQGGNPNYERCSLNAQLTTYKNSQPAAPGTCHDYLPCQASADPAKSGQSFCYPGGTQCGPDLTFVANGQLYQTYLAYRWLDADADGVTDLVAAVHGSVDAYDIGRGNMPPPGASEPFPFAGGSWPVCPASGQVQQCKNLGHQLDDARTCSTGVCTYNWTMVNAALSSNANPALGCFQVMAKPGPGGGGLGGADTQTPYMRCEGLYPWFIFKGKGNGTFNDVPLVKYQPVPLESEQADSSIVSPYVASQNHGVLDLDGDGVLDGVIHGKEVANGSNPDAWYVYPGDGTGGMGPQRYLFPTRPHGNVGAEKNLIAASIGVPATQWGAQMGTVDLNGDGLPDHWLVSTSNSANIAMNSGAMFDVYPPSAAGETDTATAVRPSSDSTASNTIMQSGFVVAGTSDATNRLMDVDNDGRLDVVAWGGTNWVYYNVGGQFLLPGAPFPGDAVASAAARRRINASQTTEQGETMLWELSSDVTDLDGDGIAEGVSLETTPTAAFKRSIPSAVPPRLITAVHNGRGLHSFVTYASMHEGAASPNPTVVQSPTTFWWDGQPKATPREQWVVKSVRVEDWYAAAAGTGRTTTYQYSNPRQGRDDAGYSAFRGFETVTTTGQTGAKTIQTYGYNVDWSGRLVKSVVVSAESPTTAVTVDKTNYSPFYLFGGALKTFHVTSTEHFTCGDTQSEAVCTASASAPVIYTRSDSTFTAKASNTTPDVALMYVQTKVRTQHAIAPANNDRESTQTFWLAADGATYRLRPDTSTNQVQLAGSLVTYAKSRTTWNSAAPAYASKLTDEVWVDGVDANRSVTTYNYEATTGNLLSVTTPRGNTSSYEYDISRKLFVEWENFPFVHDVKHIYEYGTGATIETQGPNVAPCSVANPPNCTGTPPLYSETNRVVIDGMGRPLERWETININPTTYDLRKVETTTYVDTPPSSLIPSSMTHQSALKEVSGTITYVQDKTELDGHGRPISVTRFAGGAPVADSVTRFAYRLDGTLQNVTVPHPTTMTVNTVSYAYTFDSLGRPIGVRRPDAPNTGVDMSYASVLSVGVSTSTREFTTTGKKAEIRRTVDADGRLAKVEEKTAEATDGAASAWAITLYDYDAANNVTKITDPETKITLLSHDQAGHRTRIDRSGRQWDYTYDKDGNVSTETAPCDPQPTCRAAFTTTLAYDILDRVSVRNIAPRTLSGPDLALFGAAQERLDYDTGSNARGRMNQWHAWGPSAETQNQAFSYDPQGRVLQNWMAFNSAGYSTVLANRQSYSLGGLPERTEFGDYAGGGTWQTVADQTYDERGLPKSASISTNSGGSFGPSIVDTRTVAGTVTKRRVDYPSTPTPPMSYVESVWAYDILGRVTSQTINKGAGTVQVAKQALTYFGNDDVNTLTTSLGTTAKTQTFTFDYQHQLKTVASGTPNNFGATYAYGAAGRFAQATVTQAVAPPSPSEVKPRNVFYNYAGTDPELVTSLNTGSLTGPAYMTYTYDASGNQLTRTEASTGDVWTYLCDGKDRLRRATQKHNNVVTGTEEYWYDASGSRSQLVKRNGAGTVTEMIWFQGPTEAHFNVGGVVTFAYAHVGGARVTRTSDFGTTTEYQFHGLASSTLAAVESNGTINASFNYAPFGEVIESTNAGGAAGTAAHKRRLNDKQQDDLTGLSYYGARYYDRTLMGWTQVDPLFLRVPDLAKQSTPRRSNLGAFSLNNPVRYMDPDGRDSVPSLMHNGHPAGMCLQDASGACQMDSGAAVHDGEKSWLASNTPGDKSKRGAERGAAAAAAFNATQAARPSMRTLDAGRTVIAGMEEVIPDLIIPAVEEFAPGVEAELGALEARADEAVEAIETRVEEAVETITSPVYTNLASAQRTTHILTGDANGGGHLWPGVGQHIPFPSGWSADQIMNAISEIATNPQLQWIQQTGRAGSMYTRLGDAARFITEGVVDNLLIRVVIEPAGEGIITGWPLY